MRKSTRREDIYDHFDFEISKGGASWKVEVKSRKRFPIIGKDGRPTYDFILVEWRGITGHDGWIHGKADCVAIERTDGFYLIPRAILRDTADKLTPNEWCNRKEDMLYKMYGRKDREDMVCAILLDDIKDEEGVAFWPK